MTADVVRIMALAAGAATFPLATAVLTLSFLVLRPRPLTWATFTGSGAGFLFLHIILVTIAFELAVVAQVIEVVARADQPVTFRPPLLLSSAGLMLAGYVIIFRVELARLRLKALNDG